MFVIVHSGQTGVERGAHEAALAAGFNITGFTTSTCRDELGPLPSHVSSALVPSSDAGPRAAIKANLAISDAVLLVVPVADDVARFPAMDWILRGVRARQLPMLVCDRATHFQHAVSWASTVRRDRTPLRLFVTGPRATRWPDGADIARRLVLALAIED